MHNEYTTTKLIASEFMDYFFYYGMNELRLDIRVLDDQTLIAITGRLKEVNPQMESTLNRLIDHLFRQPELEDYYSDLLGVRNDKFDWNILAAMLDEVDYHYDEKKQLFTARLVRNRVSD